MGEIKFYLGRQPILDAEQQVFGYELLFRTADSLVAEFSDSLQASASVIFNILSGFGFAEVLGDRMGFVNVDEEVLISEAVELLPREQIVVELLEGIELNSMVVERCRDLKQKGFCLALDDHVYDREFEPLYDIVDIVKLDLASISTDVLPDKVARLRRWPVRLLAEKVETVEQYELCRGLGFDYFQGYYFARPVVLTKTRIDIGRITFVRLLNQLLADSQVEEIEETFRHHPSLTYNLLRLVNSVGTGLREQIHTVRHALMILGFQQLKRWTLMALFACKGSHGKQNPLFEMAAMRGKLMELLVNCRTQTAPDREAADRAFMTGILSLIDVLFETPMDEIVTQLNLDDDLRRALMNREGELGRLLHVAEKREQNDLAAMRELLEQNGLDLDDLLTVQGELLTWLSKIDHLA